MDFLLQIGHKLKKEKKGTWPKTIWGIFGIIPHAFSTFYYLFFENETSTNNEFACGSPFYSFDISIDSLNS